MDPDAELVRRAHAAYGAGFKARDPAPLLSLLDPAVEWETNTKVMEGTYRGPEGVGRWMAEFWESWEELEVATEEAIAGEDGLVYAAIRLEGRGKTSGIRVETTVFEVIEVRNGLIATRRGFPDRDRALRAAGLPA